jgi:YVTN family beta-propeller protein
MAQEPFPLSIVQNNTLIESISVESSPTVLEYNPSNNNIYVANHDSRTVTIIYTSSNTIVDNVVVNNEPMTLEYNSAKNNIYVANRGSRTVSVIDGVNNTLIENIVGS